jgi:hypothetical protein
MRRGDEDTWATGTPAGALTAAEVDRYASAGGRAFLHAFGARRP